MGTEKSRQYGVETSYLTCFGSKIKPKPDFVYIFSKPYSQLYLETWNLDILREKKKSISSLV